MACELGERLIISNLVSISFLIRVLDESTAATAVFRAADDCFMLRVSRLLPDLFDADARARRLRAQFPSLLHLSASFLRQLRRRGYEWVLALLRRAELHQVHFVRLLLQQLLDVCVPLIVVLCCRAARCCAWRKVAYRCNQ